MKNLRDKISYFIGHRTGTFSPVSGPRYRIGLISDTHVSTNSGTTPSGKHDWNFVRALKGFENLGVDEVIVTGDCVANNNTETTWKYFQKLIQYAEYPEEKIFTCTGNHDANNDNSYKTHPGPDGKTNYTWFKQYANKAIFNNEANSTAEPYFAIDLHGDRFIFIALDLEDDPDDASGNNPSGHSCFSDEQMDWLENELEEHYGKGKNVWIIGHLLFYGWGAGDVIESPKYNHHLKLVTDETDSTYAAYYNNLRFKNLLIKYPDCIFPHGHSHFRLDTVQNLARFTAPDQGGCYQLHVPSLSGAKDVVNGSYKGDGSQDTHAFAWFCEIYNDKIVFQAVDFRGKGIDPTAPPAAGYTLDDIKVDYQYTINLLNA